MIPRYSRPEMSALWSDDTKYSIWLEVETLALEAMAEQGLAPLEAARVLRQKGRFDSARVLEIEKQVKHDVIAFLTNVAESVGPHSRYVHRGMTSSDLLDTTLAVQLQRSGKLILQGLDRTIELLKKRAEEFRSTPCIGRSHGIHAEPTTFGLKLLGWFTELSRQRKVFCQALELVCVGKISGAVGTFSSIPPEVEASVMQRLGIRAEPVATQVVARDRHAHFFSALALIGSSIERFCIEIRHLQRTEVREVSEAFGDGQKGSSAMPHKKNPILSENLSGLARLLRGYSLSAMENIALWHERDISHSSVERVIGPDACILMDFMLDRFYGLLEGLVVFPDRMLENLELSRGLVFSGALLIALVDAGILREEAYALVQKHALAAWEGGATFYERILADQQIRSRLGVQEIEQLFDLQQHLRHVDSIFERALRQGDI